MLLSILLLKGHAITGKRILKQTEKTSLYSEISYITYRTSPIKHIAGKGISLISQWSRGNLCCWPTQGLRACPLGSSECETLQAGSKSQPEGTRADSQLSFTSRYALPPLPPASGETNNTLCPSGYSETPRA